MFSKLPITSITPFTFQDYREHTACILWFFGCNMRCDYCHNPELVRGRSQKLSLSQIMDFLGSRQGLLEAVVLSGGECTLCPALPNFARRLKSMGYKVKIDTNGTHPLRLLSLIEDGLVDYIALDFKAPAHKYKAITHHNSYAKFSQSLEIIIAAKIDKEIRTTVHSEQLDYHDINEMTLFLEKLKYKGGYFIQNFSSGSNLGNIKPSAKPLAQSQILTRSFPINFRNF